MESFSTIESKNWAFFQSIDFSALGRIYESYAFREIERDGAVSKIIYPTSNGAMDGGGLAVI